MAGSILQAAFAEGTSPLSLAFPTGLTAGSTIVVFGVDAAASGQNLTCADTHGTLGTHVDLVSDIANGNSLASFVKTSVVSGADTVTLTGGAAGHAVGVCIVEVSGVGILDGHNAQNQVTPGNSTDAISSNTDTPTATAFQVALSIETNGTVAAPNAGTGFTSTAGGNVTVLGWQFGTGLNLARLEWKASVSSGAAHAGTFTDATNGSSHNYDTLMVMLDESAAAPKTPYMPYGLQPSLAM